MFSAMTANAPFYIFTKTEQPKLEIGYVESFTKPRMAFPTTYPNYSQPIDTVIDSVSVRVGEESVKFDSIPSNASVHTYNNGSVVVSNSKEAILSEIENTHRTSKSILDSIGYHENIVGKCEEFMKMLNPQIAENQKRDEKLGKLENDLAELKQMLSAALSARSTT